MAKDQTKQGKRKVTRKSARNKGLEPMGKTIDISDPLVPALPGPTQKKKEGTEENIMIHPSSSSDGKEEVTLNKV